MKNLKRFNEELNEKFDKTKLSFLKKLITELIDIKKQLRKENLIVIKI